MSTSPPSLPLTHRSVSLIGLLTEAVWLLGRYFIIVYPVFGYFILSSLIIPRTLPDFSHWGWWVILLGLVIIFYLFKAGWSTMMHQAVKEWDILREKLANQTLSRGDIQPIPFSLLQYFMAGINNYGLAFLLGGLFWGGLACIPITLVGLLVWQWIGIPNHFVNTVMQNPEITNMEIQKLFFKLSPLEQWQIEAWSWLIIVLMGCFLVLNVLTLYWQQYLIIHATGVVSAFKRSVALSYKHPFKTIAMMGFNAALSICFTTLSNFTNILGFVGNFMLIVSMVYSGLLLFLYLQRVDPPITTTQSDA